MVHKLKYSCLICGPCSHTTAHKLPLDPAKRNLWLNFIKKLNLGINILHLSGQSRLCSNHFKPNDYISLSNNRLHESAVPSVFYKSSSISQVIKQKKCTKNKKLNDYELIYLGLEDLRLFKSRIINDNNTNMVDTNKAHHIVENEVTTNQHDELFCSEIIDKAIDTNLEKICGLNTNSFEQYNIDPKKLNLHFWSFIINNNLNESQWTDVFNNAQHEISTNQYNKIFCSRELLKKYDLLMLVYETESLYTFVLEQCH